MTKRLTQDGPRRGPAISLPAAQAERFLAALTQGASTLECCKISGISYRGFCAWRAADRRGTLTSREVEKFLRVVERTEAEGTAVLIGGVRLAARADWRAAAWLIDRRDRKGALLAAQQRARAEATLLPQLLQARIDALTGAGAALAGATDDELAQVATVLETVRRRRL